MMENQYRDLAKTLLEEAQAAGYLDGPFSVIQELYDHEQTLFQLLFAQMGKHLETAQEAEFSESELLNLFHYVYAKAAEAVGCHCNYCEITFSAEGMFDGNVPLYAPEGLVNYFKALNFPADMLDAFQRWHQAKAENEELQDVDPLLLLFEALKWTWRIAIHLAVDFLETNGHKFEEGSQNGKEVKK